MWNRHPHETGPKSLNMSETSIMSGMLRMLTIRHFLTRFAAGFNTFLTPPQGRLRLSFLLKSSLLSPFTTLATVNNLFTDRDPGRLIRQFGRLLSVLAVSVFLSLSVRTVPNCLQTSNRTVLAELTERTLTTRNSDPHSQHSVKRVPKSSLSSYVFLKRRKYPPVDVGR